MTTVTTVSQKKCIPRRGKSALAIGIIAATSLASLPENIRAADSESFDKLEQENKDLRTRLDVLEGIARKEGILPNDKSKSKLVSAMSGVSISGFVQASYFYNLDKPADKHSDGYLWNNTDNSFSLNKFKLTLASPPVATDSWDAGFRTSLLLGEDSPNLNTGSPMAGFESLREAFVELNVPVGTGLNVKAGQLISLLNYESGDGGAANDNFSQGNQWWFTGNGPSAGVQLGYSLTETVGLKVRVQNGMFAGPVDSNEGKALLTSLGFKPTDKSWVSLIGWYSEENATTDVTGGSILAGYKITDNLNTGLEADYFHFVNALKADSDLWSIGTWFSYSLTSKTALALRADYIQNPDGVLGPAVRPNAGILSPDLDGSLGSLTLTYNYKPTPNLKIQPEIRYDYTTYTGLGGAPGALDGSKTRVIVGAGISYLF
jgi:Putative beta-barrel porin-2, OmpL-like. bbp2